MEGAAKRPLFFFEVMKTAAGGIIKDRACSDSIGK
jgi:hypothetical protein